MLGSILFHYKIVDEKEKFLKKTCFALSIRMLGTAIGVYGIKQKRYSGWSFLKTLYKIQSFLYHHRSLTGSKPNS